MTTNQYGQTTDQSGHVLTTTEQITAWITHNLPELNPAQVKMLAGYILERENDSYFRGAKAVQGTEGTA